MARRQHLTLTVAAALLLFVLFTYFFSSTKVPSYSPFAADPGLVNGSTRKADPKLSDSILKEGSIAPKLENATAKAELGRATWKFLHTTMARFPEKPTPDESETLKTFITLFSRLYPCGECAAHFRTLLEKFPPQTSSRQAAAGWACHVHNQVNKRLKKPQFDCNNIGDFYDCGCGDDDAKGKKEMAGEEGLKGRENMHLEKEGLARGG